MFHAEDWARTAENYTAFWNHSLKRPLLKAQVSDGTAYTGEIPLLLQNTVHRLDVPAEELVERMDFCLRHTVFLGDAFPFVSFDAFGPGVLSAFVGAELRNDTGHVWFECKRFSSLSDIHIAFDRENRWYKRLRDIYQAGMKKWQGSVLMGMVDLGGAYDILAALRGTQNLLMDLYDEPEELERVANEIQEAWCQMYGEICEILFPQSPGYADWSGLFSASRSHIIQCDFSSMIGPAQFEEQLLPLLRGQVNWLDNSVYHLDGKGSLQHLDSLLKLEKLGAVQWVTGAGERPPREWIGEYQKIKAAGKGIQVLGEWQDFTAIAQQLGGDGLYYDIQPLESCEYLWVGNTMGLPAGQPPRLYAKQELETMLQEYGVPV